MGLGTAGPLEDEDVAEVAGGFGLAVGAAASLGPIVAADVGALVGVVEFAAVADAVCELVGELDAESDGTAD